MLNVERAKKKKKGASFLCGACVIDASGEL